LDPNDSAVFCLPEVFMKYITGVVALKTKHDISPLLSARNSYGGKELMLF
jgi:hypothetical protein